MTPDALQFAHAMDDINNSVVFVMPVLLLLFLIAMFLKLIRPLIIEKAISYKPESPFKVPFYRPMQVACAPQPL